MHLVVGLGNPGRRYARTRHNVGFLVVDRLAERTGESVDSKKYGAMVGKARVGGETVVLAKPQGFMNRSGQPVASLAGYYKADTSEVIVVHDDLDLAFDEVRVKQGGGHGGHNGLRDVSRAMGQGYARVRVGLGRPPEGWDPADYVLGTWSGSEQDALDAIVDRAADAVEAIVRDGVTAAMNITNARVASGSSAAGAQGSPGR